MIVRVTTFVFVLMLMLLACQRQAGAESASTAPASNPSRPDVQVVIDNFTFSPAEVEISVGTKVTWVNHDDVPHSATSSVKPRLFDSKALDTDQTYSFVFDKPGTYPYFCIVHPHMTGKVIVK